MPKNAPILWLVLLLASPKLAYCEEAATSQFTYDEFIQDEGTREKVLKVVREHVSESVAETGYVVVKDQSLDLERKFVVVQMFDVVSRKGDVYTVQIDVDEVDGEPRHVLFADVIGTDDGYRLIGMRIGPRHLRQDSE